MYPVLFKWKQYQVTSLTEKGRSVSSVAKHIFFIKHRKNTRLRRIEVRIKFKKAKLLGETGIGRRILGSPRKISEKV